MVCPSPLQWELLVILLSHNNVTLCFTLWKFLFPLIALGSRRLGFSFPKLSLRFCEVCPGPRCCHELLRPNLRNNPGLRLESWPVKLTWGKVAKGRRLDQLIRTILKSQPELNGSQSTARGGLGVGRPSLIEDRTSRIPCTLPVSVWPRAEVPVAEQEA